VPETEPETPAITNDGESADPPSRHRWRWIVPLLGILAVATFIWVIFLPPGASDAAAEAVCITTARLGFTLESRPVVTADTPVGDLETWLPETGGQVVVVADLARSIRMNINELVGAYDALVSEVRAVEGTSLGPAAGDVEARVDDLARAVESMSEAANC
jgi:hypothetical protein